MNIPINNEQIRIRVKADPIISTGGTSGSTTYAVSLGGEPIYKQKVGNTLQFKGLEAGNGITLTPSATGVTITANVTGVTGYVTESKFNTYTGATATHLNSIDADIDYVSGQTASKLPTSRFNTYTGNTQTALNNKVDKSNFNTYTGNTATQLNNINSELDLAITGGTSGTGIAVSKIGRNLVITYTGATGGNADGVVSGGTLNGTILELKRTLSLPDVDIELSGLTSSYLPTSRFNIYTGATATALSNKLDKSTFNTFTGTTAPATYKKISEFNTYTGTTATDINSRLLKTTFNTFTGTTAPATYATKSSFETFTGTTAPATYKKISEFNSYTGATQTALNSKVSQTNFNTYTGNTSPVITAAVTGGTSLGTGAAIYSDKTGRNLRFKSLVAGSNITLTPSSTGVTISSTGGGGAYLPLSGGTVTGQIIQLGGSTAGLILSGSTGKSIEIRSAAGQLKDLVFSTGANARWVLRSNSISESGSNVGSDFQILRRADNGSAIDVPFSITRSTGLITISDGLDLHGDVVSITGATTLNQASHAGRIIECSGTFTVTLPNSLPTGCKFTIVNVGTGVITIAASGTLQSLDSRNKLRFQYAGATAYCRGSNTWLLIGNLQE